MSNKTDVLIFDGLKKFAINDILSVSGKDKTARVIETHMNNLIEVALMQGKQSKQSEVDELKKRIESAIELLEYNEHVDYALQALEILKGE